MIQFPKKWVYFFFLLFFILPVELSYSAGPMWESTTNVPVSDPVYRKLDKLIAAGLIKDTIYGQRPWSRGEIARLISIALKARTKQLEEGGPDAENFILDQILDELPGEYHEELVARGDQPGIVASYKFHPLEEVRLDQVFLDSSFRPVLVNNNLGLIDMEVNPLVGYREGRHYVDGNTVAFETVHRANLSKHFSLYANPRFESLFPESGSNSASAVANQLYGKFAFHNFELEVGRDEVIWGQGAHGGVLASDNARGLDMVRLTTSAPFHHPWIFKYLGPSKYTFFLANLGPEYVLKNAFLYDFAASFKPASFLELGFEHEVTLSGDGAPNVGFANAISEFFLVRRTGGSGVDAGPNVADHRLGFNIRGSIPQLNGMVLYVENILEDLGRHSFYHQFVDLAAWQVGIYMPLLTSDGQDDLRLEYQYMAPIYGRHSSWTSGLSENRLSRGSDLGPDAESFRLEWNHDLDTGTFFQGAAIFEQRDGDLFTQPLSSEGTAVDVVKTVDNPTEDRFRLTSAVVWPCKLWLDVKPQAGYEHVWNTNFVQGASRNNFLAEIQLVFKPESYLSRNKLAQQ